MRIVRKGRTECRGSEAAVSHAVKQHGGEVDGELLGVEVGGVTTRAESEVASGMRAVPVGTRDATAATACEGFKEERRLTIPEKGEGGIVRRVVEKVVVDEPALDENIGRIKPRDTQSEANVGGFLQEKKGNNKGENAKQRTKQRASGEN